MHILLIVSWYKNHRHPMSGTFFEEQARALQRMGYKVGVFCTEIEMRFASRFEKSDHRLNRVYDDQGLPTIYHSVKSVIPRNRALNYYYLCLTSAAKFQSYIKKHGKPDLIHAHCVFAAGIVARYISKRYSLPYVVTEHFTGLIIQDISKFPYNRKAIKRVYKSSRANLIVSSSFARDLTNKYHLRHNLFHVVPNMVDRLFFAPVTRQKIEKEIILFTNSFLSRKKNHVLLFEALKIVLQTYSNVQLRVGGDGELAAFLRKRVVELEIQDNVHFLGSLNRTQVRDQIKECHLFVSSSAYETFGVAITEALAGGRPVIATNSGGPADIINDRNGFLVQEHTPTELASAIVNSIKRYDLFDQQWIAADCSARFSEEVVMNNLKEIYEHAIEQRLS